MMKSFILGREMYEYGNSVHIPLAFKYDFD